MATYAYTNATLSAAGVGPTTLYTNAATASVIIGLTVTNVLTDPITVTVVCNGVKRANAEPLGPGAVMSMIGSQRWILTGAQTITVASNTAASMDVQADIITVT